MVLAFVGDSTTTTFNFPTITSLFVQVAAPILDNNSLRKRNSVSGMPFNPALKFKLKENRRYGRRRQLASANQFVNRYWGRTENFDQGAMLVGRAMPLLEIAALPDDHSFGLMFEALDSLEADEVYDQRDAQGFIKLNALRLQLLQAAQKRFGG